MSATARDDDGRSSEGAARPGAELVTLGDLPLPAYVWKRDGSTIRLTECNELAREFDPAIDRVIGMSLDDLAPDNPELAEHIRSALEGETAALAEVPYRRSSDGSLRRLACSFAHMPSGAVIVHAEDTTGRRDAERSLREANARFQAAFERSPLAKLLVGVDEPGAGVIIDVNDTFCSMFGYARAELIGRAVPRDLDMPDDLHVARQFEKRFRHRDGSATEAIVWTSLVDGPGGGPRFALCTFQDVTERRQADAALRQSEARYRQIVETTSEGVWVIDADDRTTFVSERMAEMLGYTPAEMLGTKPGDYELDGKSPPIREMLARRPQGVSEQHETRLRRRDGSPLWVSISNDSLPSADGSYAGSLAMISDITERKRAEGELREAKLRFEGAFAQAPIGMALVNLDEAAFGELLLVNTALSSLLGYKDGELLGRSLTALTHPDDVASNLEAAHEMAAGDLERYEVPKRFLRRDGSEVLTNMSASVVRGADGAILYAVAHIQDITARRRAEDELEERERRFRAAFASALDAMLIADDDRLWTEGNRAAAELLGIPIDQIPGRRLDEFSDRPSEELAARWESFIDAGEMTGEFQIRRPDGEIRDVEFGATANFTPGRHLSTLRDVTDRKRAQAESEALEAALNQAQRLETVGQLAGGVAHDFNNVLAVILGSSEFALGELGDHPAAEDVRAMRAAAERAAALTRQLLVFSRREIARPQVIPLNGIVASVERLLRRTIGEHIELVVKLEDDLPAIEADPSHVEQILLNLAVNARDAMPDGGTMRVETRAVTLDDAYARLQPELSPGRYVMLAVSDTGCGMSEAVLQRAFDPFFTTKPKGSGTGLGLATTYGIVKQNHGHITLYSEPGQGTAAKVYLPAVTEGGTTRAEADAAAPPSGHGERILLVEDEEAVRSVAERILTTHGYEVVPVATPLAALELADSEPAIDLVLTDVVMPGLTGGQLVGMLRERIPGLPAVFMSGYSDRLSSLPDDAGFVSKPFPSRTLLEEVARVLEESV
jgi:two-component system, cell cycle sensor histidine kinase and response regulator CckA